MTDAAFPDSLQAARFSACPACDAAGPALEAARSRAGETAGVGMQFAVPAAHCAACISVLENGLAAEPGIRSARLNLTLRRVSVEAAPGLAPETVIAAIARLGYRAEELDAAALAPDARDPETRDLLMRVAVAGFAMMNVMLLSVAVWSGAEAATRDLFHWISAAIALPAVAFSGRPFFASAFAALRVGRTNMEVPISLGIVLATATSLYETAQSGEHAYFDAAVALTFFLLVGRYLDRKSRAAARSAASELTALEVPRAARMAGNAVEWVPVAALRAGDLVKVFPGMRVPADGSIVTGESEIDRSILTGESLPVPVAPGTVLAAGEMNLTGALTMTVRAAGRDSSLSRLADLVAVAEAGRGRYRSIADRVVRYYAPFVHAMALASLAGWLWATGDLRLALNIAAAVLIVTCPCALGLAVPAVLTAASGRLFRRGLLIKDGTALERLAEVDCVVLDKTGTLTEGLPKPEALDGHMPGDLAVALALAGASAHPLARALSDALAARGIAPATVTGLCERPGRGIEARLGDTSVRLGRAEWLGAGPGAQAGPATWLRIGEAAPVAFRFVDRLRPGAGAMVAGFAARGMAVHLLSGDTEAPVAELAHRLGITEYRAGIGPADKAAYLARLRDSGRRVLMIGDGLNDTAALAGAHVAIAPASGLDAARTAADIVLLGGSLAPVAEAQAIALQAVARMRENIVIANLYNLVAVPLAVLGFCTPLLAALAMSSSSLTVTLNALRLRR